MLLNDITTSEDIKIAKINKVLKETYGFTLVSDVKSGKLNALYTKISDDLYSLKLNLNTAKSPKYMQKVLVLEGLKILIQKNKDLHESLMVGPGANAYERVNKCLIEFVRKACEVGDEYEEAIRDAMKQYRSSKYRFLDDVVEFDLRKATKECSGFSESINEDSICKDCECDPCECDKDEIAEAGPGNERCDDCGLWRDQCECNGDIPPYEDKFVPTKWHKEEEIEEDLNNIKPQNIWWENDPKELMSFIYWKRNQIQPGGDDYVPAWNSVIAALSKKNPPPADWVNPMPLEETGDRHAEHDWIKTIKKDQGIGYQDDGPGGLSLADPDEQPKNDADDYFSYRSKQKRNKMKEGHIKKLRRLLEAEVEQAESLIAAKSFSQELQDMVEKLGRLVNENLPAVSEQMRDAYGSDVATGFEDQVSGTLNSVMDSLRDSKQEIDNSVATIADGGAPLPGNDMDDFSDEELGGGEFGDEELDLDGDVDLELGDEFGGDVAVAGPEDEPLGRAKKESIKILGKKILEAEKKLARIKTRQ